MPVHLFPPECLFSFFRQGPILAASQLQGPGAVQGALGSVQGAGGRGDRFQFIIDKGKGAAGAHSLAPPFLGVAWRREQCSASVNG